MMPQPSLVEQAPILTEEQILSMTDEEVEEMLAKVRNLAACSQYSSPEILRALTAVPARPFHAEPGGAEPAHVGVGSTGGKAYTKRADGRWPRPRRRSRGDGAVWFKRHTVGLNIMMPLSRSNIPLYSHHLPTCVDELGCVNSIDNVFFGLRGCLRGDSALLECPSDRCITYRDT
jgi:hypothetical protein